MQQPINKKQPPFFSFEKRIAAFSILVLLIIASVIFIYIRLADTAKAGRSWVTHTEQVLALTDTLLARENSIVIATRSFIITGNAKYLQTYRQADAAFAGGLEKLKYLVRDNLQQQDRVDSLTVSYAQYTSIRKQAISIRNEKGFRLQDAEPIIDSADLALSGLRARFNDIRKEEKRLLAERRADLRKMTQQSAVVIRALLLLFIISIFLAIIIVYRNTLKRNKAEEELLVLNRELEQRVAERTERAMDQEMKYRFLLENMREGIQVIGFDWRYLFVNDSNNATGPGSGFSFALPHQRQNGYIFFVVSSS